jgi:DNA topoisomerase-3
VNTAGDLRSIWPRLSADERRLFMIIARSYLASLMPDFRYRQTTALLDVHGHAFRAVGRQPIEIGWRAAFGEDAEREDDEDAQMLPSLRNGEPANLSDPKVEAKETKPPPRYNEGTLIEAMANAWRFVENPEHRERLKEAKGIGTPATRAEIIQGLKRQEFLVASGKNIVPTERGLVLFDVLWKADQALVDPAVTAKLEFLLDEVLYGRRRTEEAIDAVCGQASRIIGRLRDGTPSDGIPLPAVSPRPIPMERGGDKSPRRKARPAGSPPQEENGQLKIPRRRARPAAAKAQSGVQTAVTAPARRRTAKKLKASSSATGKAADLGARDASAPGPAKRCVSRGKLARVATPSGEVRQSAAGDDGTRLNIPFGNKELAMSLGARYRTGGWFAPPGTHLEPFQEKGWL